MLITIEFLDLKSMLMTQLKEWSSAFTCQSMTLDDLVGATGQEAYPQQNL